MKEISLPFVAKFALVILSIIMIGYLAILGKSLLAPMLFSLLMAFLILPFSNFLEQYFKFKRSLAAITSVVLMIAILYGLFYFLASQLALLWADWPLLVKQVTKAFYELRDWASLTFHVDFKTQKNPLSMDNAEKALATSATIIGTTLLTLSSSLLFLALIIERYCILF